MEVVVVTEAITGQKCQKCFTLWTLPNSLYNNDWPWCFIIPPIYLRYPRKFIRHDLLKSVIYTAGLQEVVGLGWTSGCNVGWELEHSAGWQQETVPDIRRNYPASSQHKPFVWNHEPWCDIPCYSELQTSASCLLHPLLIVIPPNQFIIIANTAKVE